jgi:hypothetical protein
MDNAQNCANYINISCKIFRITGWILRQTSHYNGNREISLHHANISSIILSLPVFSTVVSSSLFVQIRLHFLPFFPGNLYRDGVTTQLVLLIAVVSDRLYEVLARRTWRRTQMSVTGLLNNVLTETQAAPKAKLRNAEILKTNKCVSEIEFHFECNGILHLPKSSNVGRNNSTS